MIQSKMYWDGKWQQGQEAETQKVRNPYNGEVVGTIRIAAEHDVVSAIDAASIAFSHWSSLPAIERAGYLKKWHELILKNQESIAEILTREQGKPLGESRKEIMSAARYLEWYAEEAVRVYGETIPSPSMDKRVIVLQQPIGVVAALTPWNFPGSMVTRKIAPALAAGCTVILKPSSKSPLTAVQLIQMAHEAGIPPGVVNLVTGKAESITQILLGDYRVRKVTFTGSTAVGKQILKHAAESLKRVSLELGGHAPYLIFEDADIDKAVSGILQAKLRNGGQMCVAANRILVHESVCDEFVARLRQALKGMRMGDGMDPDVTIGPLIDRKAYEKVQDHVSDAREKGAGLILGGQGYQEGNNEAGGYFFYPTILTNIKENMRIMNEETFGPVVAVRRFSSDKEAINLANASPYGLAAYVFTESLSRGIRMAELLEYGVIGLNDAGPSTTEAPFGGFKESGLGREGGHQGISAYLETKMISLRLSAESAQ